MRFTVLQVSVQQKQLRNWDLLPGPFKKRLKTFMTGSGRTIDCLKTLSRVPHNVVGWPLKTPYSAHLACLIEVAQSNCWDWRRLQAASYR